VTTEAGTGGSMARRGESVAVVVVTFNRAELLGRTLDGLAAQTHPADSVIVVDNASTDHTREILDAHRGLPLQRIHLGTNTGGSGGFRAGVEAAYDQGFDRIWLMDDDVVPAPDCLALLMACDDPCLMAVREDVHGRLVEKAATRFDLTHAWVMRPKRASVETTYGDRHAMPERVELEIVAFEGFLVRREVITAIGLPDDSFFIFYDDVDLALRARRAGYRIWAVRDAVLVRQLDFDQQHALDTWKGYYMYRNLFAVHFRYGANPVVRAKPYLIAAGVVALSPLRGGRPEARNVIRAIRRARTMRSIPGSAPVAR
jgi:rhamnopyranosyl-N-acetylglucosaminyl-diphospho-decaprenol beta-1,3/1,4-galactofuranosyltransferase